MEEGVQPVVGGVVEEEAGVLRSPDHDGRRPLAGPLPLQDALHCPYERLGTLARFQLDVGGRVEGDQLLGDRGVQRGTQGGADAMASGGTNDPAVRLHLGDGRLHRLAAGAVIAALPRNPGELLDRLAAGEVRLGYLDVGLGDGLEHLREVGDAEAVKPHVADARLQVDADVALVAADGALAALLSGQPHVQPVADGEPARQVDPVAEATPGGLDVWQGRLLGRDGLQERGDGGQPLRIVGFGEAEEGADVVEVALGVLERVVAGAAEGAAGAILARREFLADGVGAVLAGGELRAVLAERLAGLGVAAVAAAVGGAFQRRSSGVVSVSGSGGSTSLRAAGRSGGVAPSSRSSRRRWRSLYLAEMAWSA